MQSKGVLLYHPDLGWYDCAAEGQLVAWTSVEGANLQHDFMYTPFVLLPQLNADMLDKDEVLTQVLHFAILIGMGVVVSPLTWA